MEVELQGTPLVCFLFDLGELQPVSVQHGETHSANISRLQLHIVANCCKAVVKLQRLRGADGDGALRRRRA